jgi:hypothetical protein
VPLPEEAAQRRVKLLKRRQNKSGREPSDCLRICGSIA